MANSLSLQGFRHFSFSRKEYRWKISKKERNDALEIFGGGECEEIGNKWSRWEGGRASWGFSGELTEGGRGEGTVERNAYVQRISLGILMKPALNESIPPGSWRFRDNADGYSRARNSCTNGDYPPPARTFSAAGVLGQCRFERSANRDSRRTLRASFCIPKHASIDLRPTLVRQLSLVTN